MQPIAATGLTDGICLDTPTPPLRLDVTLAEMAQAATAYLSGPGTTTQRLNTFLGVTGTTFDLDRILVFKTIDESGRFVLIARWSAGSLMGPEGVRLSGFDQIDEGWARAFHLGEPVQFISSAGATGAARLLSEGDETSVLALPIPGAPQVHGFITCHGERDRCWSRTEIGLLGVCATTLAASAEHGRLETAARESDQNFRMIVDAADEMIIVSSSCGEILYANRNAAEQLDYPDGMLLGKRVVDLYAPADQVAAMGRHHELARDHDDVSTIPLVTRTGRSVPAQTRVRTGTWSGEPCTLVITHNATSETEHGARFERIFQNSPSPMALTEVPSGRFTEVNPAFLRLTGYEQSEVIGKTPAEIGMFVDPQRHLTAGELLMSSGSLTDFELRVRRSDGTTIDGAFDGEIVSSNGSVYALTTMHDLTARIEVEEALRQQFDSAITLIGAVSEIRDPYTAGHQRRVTALVMAIGTKMGLAPENLEALRVAALIHDVGKISIPAEILSKPALSNHYEREIIRRHAHAGHEIVDHVLDEPIPTIVHQHHERCDGSGYPQGLTSDQLLLESKILMVADVVEAMMSHRPYRPAHTRSAALAEVVSGAGTQFDEHVVHACVSVFDEQGFTFPGYGANTST